METAVAEIDCYRTLVFPNRIRKFRKQLNIGSLLELSERIPAITYIRLSKIERGEIFARADELRALARALGAEPTDLLVDVDDPAFDIAAWAEPLHGGTPGEPGDSAAELGAVLLAAAVRTRRGGDPALTIAVLEQDYGIAPVVLSRIENALKPLDRWNEDVRGALRRLFGAADDAGLLAQIETMHARGDLATVLPLVANPEIRLAKSRTRIAALRAELAAPAPASTAAAPTPAAAKAPPELVPELAPELAHDEPGTARIRLLPVFGTPLPEGLIARTATGALVEAPRDAGPRAYGLRLGRPTLGPGLPGRATLVVDPDRYPSAGGLAVIREAEALRVVSVAADRHGVMMGYSDTPDFAVALDTLAPSTVAAVLSAVFE